MRIFLGKKFGIREVDRITLIIFNHIELKGYSMSEKHKEFGAGSVQCAFSLENKRNLGGWERARISSQSACARGPFIFAGWWRRCILTRKRDGVGCSLSFL